MADILTFYFKTGIFWETARAEKGALTIPFVQEKAVAFLNAKFPNVGIRDSKMLQVFLHTGLANQGLAPLLDVRHLRNGSILEIVLRNEVVMQQNSNRNKNTFSENMFSENSEPEHVHSRNRVTFFRPTFCDHCSEMLWGFTEQGVKCDICEQTFHARCVDGINRKAKERMDRLENANPTTDFQPIRRHSFEMHTYKTPTNCHFCKNFLLGLFKQGLQCRSCQYNIHAKCLPQLSQDASCQQLQQQLSLDASCPRQQLQLSPTAAASPASVQGRRGSDSVAAAVAKPVERSATTAAAGRVELRKQMETEGEQLLQEQLGTRRRRSVMRKQAQSFKLRKPKESGPTILREGWLIHYTQDDPLLRRLYWILDSKSLSMYNSADPGHPGHLEQHLSLESVLFVQNGKADLNLFCSGSREYTFSFGTGEAEYFVLIPNMEEDETAVGMNLTSRWEIDIRLAASVAANSRVDIVKDCRPDIIDCGSTRLSQQYQIFPDQVLGCGQFGIVYEANDTSTGQPVAIKVIDKSRFPQQLRQTLTTEVAILQQLNHPGVIKLLRFDETTAQIKIVMEKMAGGDLFDSILKSQGGKLCERKTRFFTVQILAALKYLHDQDIVHCDLKPENILLASSHPFPQVKLCDFGFSRIIGENGFRCSIVGTPAYLAPEVLDHRAYNRSLDIWSLGVIIYVCLSGVFPFDQEQGSKSQSEEDVSHIFTPAEEWAAISRSAIGLILTLLQVDARKRPNVEECLAHVWLQEAECRQDLADLDARLNLNLA